MMKLQYVFKPVTPNQIFYGLMLIVLIALSKFSYGWDFSKYNLIILEKINTKIVKKKFNKIIVDTRAAPSSIGRGLGNQFFAFAISYAFAKKFGIENIVINNLSKCDDSPDVFNSITQRCYGLEHFSVDYPVMYGHNDLSEAEKSTIYTIGSVKQLYSITNLEDLFTKNKSSIIEIPALFEPKMYDYFKEYSTELRSLLKYKKPLSANAKLLLSQISSTNSVSIHIRRGDFLLFGLELPLEFYLKACALLIDKLPDPHFFIFTDDLAYVKQAFQQPNPEISKLFNSKQLIDYTTIIKILNASSTYVSELIEDSLEQFHLMSQCHHNIISSSTFSWWAAFLNSDPHKIVVVPQQRVGNYVPIPDNNWLVLVGH